VLEIAPSTYYSSKSRPPSALAVSDAEIGPQLKALFEKNYSVYGRRKLAKAARRAGLDVGRDHVARLMRAQGIEGASRAKKRFTTRADPAAVPAPSVMATLPGPFRPEPAGPGPQSPGRDGRRRLPVDLRARRRR
jgi:putative transposase